MLGSVLLIRMKPKCMSFHSRICPIERDHVQENRFWTKAKHSVLNKTNSGTIPKHFGFVFQNNIGMFVLIATTLFPKARFFGCTTGQTKLEHKKTKPVVKVRYSFNLHLKENFSLLLYFHWSLDWAQGCCIFILHLTQLCFDFDKGDWHSIFLIGRI
jgi:hypothetical protein